MESRPGDRPLGLVGSAISWGSSRRIGAAGARRLFRNGLAERLAAADIPAEWSAFVEEIPDSAEAGEVAPDVALDHVASHCARVADAVTTAVAAGRLPVTLGGDNSGTIGHYAGLAAALPATRPFGLIWIDAHPDANSWESSPSRSAHGMVVATVTGHGPEVLPAPPPGTIPPAAVAMLGIRSVDPGEQRFIASHDIHATTAMEAAAQGIAAALARAVGIVRTDTAGFALSIDLDAIDPAQAPGVAFPEADGLDADALCAALAGIGHEPGFLALEISEFAPEFDVDGRTELLVERLIRSVFAR
ncbi:MAG: arginase family protein [Alphaproteobacteria bacterium]